MRMILLYLAFVFLGGALLAPWLHWLVQSLGEHAGTLARQPFHRYVSRCFLVLALAGLWPFLRRLGVTSWASVGLAGKPWHGPNLLRGFALGFMSLAVVAITTVMLGGRQLNLDHTAGQVAGNLAGAMLTALIVGSMEELLFRGALFGSLRRDNAFGVALLASSGLYALLHFFQRPEPPAVVTWFSGMQLLPRMLAGFADLTQLVPGFFNLMLAGIILALAYQRTGSLFFSIGLHAGWIFWLKSYGFLTRVADGRTTWFWGTHKLIDGWFALLVLSIVAFGAAQSLRARDNTTPTQT